MPKSIHKPDTDIDRKRDQFPTLALGTYLLNHSLGPVPRAARNSMLTYLERWQRHAGDDAWAAGWWQLSEEVGDHIAGILGAAPGSVQPQANASVALAVAASCLDFGSGERRRVITTALDFPSTGYIWEEQRRLGAEIVGVPAEDGIVTPMDRLLDAIDERTKLVAVSHVSFLSSHRLDPRPIVEKAHRVGALVLLDVYQSAGVMELDASGWNVDFLIGGTIKWLCGGPSCGYLYVRPELIPDLRPRLTGWFAHAEPAEFALGPIRYADSVRRFAQGTPNIPGLYSCSPGLKLVEEVGMVTTASESRRRTNWIVEFAQEKGWRLNSPADTSQRGGSVMIGVDEPEKTIAHLAERKVFMDWRPGAGLRMSPHFFNTDEEVQEALETLASLIG